MPTDDCDNGLSHAMRYNFIAFAGSLGAVIDPLIGGRLYESIGQTAPFVINATVLALSALALWATLRCFPLTQLQCNFLKYYLLDPGERQVR